MPGTYAAAVVSTEEFALHEFSARLDGITWESEDTASTMPSSVLLWIAGSDSNTADIALNADPSVASHTLIAGGAEQCLYQLEWAESAGITTLLDVLCDREGVIWSAAGTAEEWTLDLLVPNRDALSAVYKTCTTSDIQFEITALRDLNEGQRTRVTLTRCQFEALQAAYDQGYFEIPRKLNLKDLATKLEISHQALSERLRRGHQALLDQTLRTVANQTGQGETTGPRVSVQ